MPTATGTSPAAGIPAGAAADRRSEPGASAAGAAAPQSFSAACL